MSRSFSKPIALGLAVIAGNLMNLKAAPDAFSNYDTQVAALLAQMTLDEKIGQMTQADLNCVTNRADVQKYGFGSMLSGGNSIAMPSRPACRFSQS